MKKIIPFLLVVAALLAFVSCKAEPESFTVKFDLNGGTVSKDIEDQTVKNGEKAAKPTETPVNTSSKGFKFWSLDGETEYDFNTPVRKDLTIKAVYWTVAEVAEIEKEVYCFRNIVQTLWANDNLYESTTEASKIYDISATSDAEPVGSLLMLSLLSCKYNSEDGDFDFYVTHDGKEYMIDESSNPDSVLVSFSVEENKSTKTADTEETDTYNIKLENVKIKATFTYNNSEGTTLWTETLETDFTVDAVLTMTKLVESSEDDDVFLITIDSSITVNGTKYPELKCRIIIGQDKYSYEYKGYKGTALLK